MAGGLGTSAPAETRGLKILRDGSRHPASGHALPHLEATPCSPVNRRTPRGGDRVEIVFLGDTSFGENYQVAMERWTGRNFLKERGYDASLASFQPFLQSADLVIANLETPLTNLERSPLEGRKRFIHWSDPAEAPAALKRHNVSAVALANNHAMDFGTQGLEQTLAALGAHGIAGFGAGMDAAAAAAVLEQRFNVGGLPFNLQVISAYWWRWRYRSHYHFYASRSQPGVNQLNHLFGTRIGQQVTAARSRSPTSYTIVFPHWGKSYQWRSRVQDRLAGAMARAGADLVIGHGAHSLQEVERVGRMWTVFSLGNFVFNSRGRFGLFGAPPFGLIARMIVHRFGDRLDKTLRLYPIVVDNSATNFQVRFVEENEFDAVVGLLKQRSASLSGEPRFGLNRDEFGFSLRLDLG
jgi:Bacterial capsule synthesis protein PGA_cap